MSIEGLPDGYAPIQKPVYAPAVTPELLKSLNTPNAENKHWPKVSADNANVSHNVQIKSIDNPSHPANGQYGLFAAQDLVPSSFITFYLGLVHVNESEDTNKESDYDLSFDRELVLSIDAEHLGNEARFLNDYRGVRQDGANAEFCDCWAQIEQDETNPSSRGSAESPPQLRRTRWERRMGVFVLGPGKSGKAKRGIKHGEEIVVNYGRYFWSARRGQESTDTADGEFA